MSKYMGRLCVPILAAVLLSACGGDKSNADSALATDSSMARDLALAQTDTAAQPQLTDVPAGGGTAAKAKTTTTKRPTTSTPTKTASGNTKTAGTGTSS